MTYPEFIKEWRNGDTALQVRTSGSTGIPKCISLPKEFMRKSALRTASFFHLDKFSRLHSCISPDFIGGKMMAVRAELIGCCLSWEKPSNRPLEAFPKDETIDLLAVVPSQMSYIATHSENLPNIRNIIVGGGPISDMLRRKIIESHLMAFETYGMTETASHIALRKIDGILSPFKVFDGISLSLDERGCLVIAFDTGERIATNDMVKLLSHGEFMVLGRYDDVIITGGRKVHPIDVENRIAKIINIPFMVAALSDEKWGEKVVLVVEGRMKDEEKERVLNQMRSLLGAYEVPKEIISVEALPRTGNGKLKRKEL